MCDSAHMIDGFDMVTGEDGSITVDSLDGRIWRIVPAIRVSSHTDGVCGPRSSCSFLAGGGRHGHPYARTVEEGIAMCPDGLEFEETKPGTWQADDGDTKAYCVTANYEVTCNGEAVKGRFTSLMYARNAVSRLIGTSYGY